MSHEGLKLVKKVVGPSRIVYPLQSIAESQRVIRILPLKQDVISEMFFL